MKKIAPEHVTLTDEILLSIADDVKEFLNLKTGEEFLKESVEKWVSRQYTFKVKVSMIGDIIGFATYVTDFEHLTYQKCKEFIDAECIKESEYNENSFEQMDTNIYGKLIGKKQIRGCRYHACRYIISL